MFSPRPSTQTNKVQKCLEMIVRVEDMVSHFQIEYKKNSSKNLSQRKVISRPSRHSSDSSDFSTVIPQLKKAVEVLKTRLSTSVPKAVVIPNFRRFKQTYGTSSILGPGVYSSKLPRIEQDHDFTEIPRLGEKIEHKLCTFRAKRKSLTFEETSRITIFDSIPMKSSLELKEKARIHNEKIDLARSAAKEIKEYYSEHKRVKLAAKLQRIKWMENREEILQLKNTWRLALASLAIPSILHVKISNFRIMKRRSKMFGKVFLYCSRFLGINRKNLMKRRRKITYKNVIFLKEPLANWSLSQYSRYKSMIFTIVNKTNHVNNLFNLMFKWRKSARKVVHLVKSYTVVLHHRKYILHEQIKKLALKSRTTPEYTDFLRLSSLPYNELDKIIKSYIQERLNSYIRVSSNFSNYSKRDQIPSVKVNSSVVFKGSKKVAALEAKFTLLGHPLVLLSNLLRLLNQKVKKTIRFKV